MTRAIREIAVVVPSRNEALLLPRTLEALNSAIQRFTGLLPEVLASLTVVLDSTTDHSAQILAAHPTVRVGTVCAGRVGGARNAGVAAALALARVPPSQLWIATTDADSTVPVEWLVRHHAFATGGADVLTGTVEPAAADLGRHALAQWFACHDLGEGHPHVHGANMGFRADVFEALGGFADQALHEDRDFVALARARGHAVVATDSCRVTTSGRRHGRLDGGFAAFLAALDPGREPSRAP
ncbi:MULTISPECIES: glycosyltransferase family 2 protein [unclassified Arthrobacter]|uniref:glycosyltransferase n=1 Tax=unclassified Arthrobacter TaxID=235627 RepID=UPI00159D6F58|nr:MULTISPECIES: glycosyltransferase [unclassified Arthrobacter]MCQ9165995.1 glycosyltransferase [Arthrobacter sp. STN4]NVM98705.1 glycosyltransferase [Arthrobacter sp. SDTb3-6]